MAGKIAINQVQLGDSATASQNFVLQTNVDGTMKLSRGNVGAIISDIFTVDANDKINLATPRYVSTAQTITSAGLLTLAHGLGAKPYRIITTAICTTADAGYSVGDEVHIPVGAGPVNNTGITCRVDATNIYIRFGSNAGALSSLQGATGAGNTTLVNTSWQFYVRAEL